MDGTVNTCELSCAVTVSNTLLATRIGFGGYPRGQPPYRMPKGQGTRAWRQSGRRREGAESADPQDLHDVVKAALPEVQFPVGPIMTHRQSALRRCCPLPEAQERPHIYSGRI